MSTGTRVDPLGEHDDLNFKDWNWGIGDDIERRISIAVAETLGETFKASPPEVVLLNMTYGNEPDDDPITLQVSIPALCQTDDTGPAWEFKLEDIIRQTFEDGEWDDVDRDGVKKALRELADRL